MITPKANAIILETPRTIIKIASSSPEDVDLFYNLWTNAQVMTNVGFPQGLKITKDEMKETLSKTSESEFNAKLKIVLKSVGQLIGECKLGLPNAEGISNFDLKLLPDYWGIGLATEIMTPLVDYIFNNSDCKAVEGTPNKKNIASIKMQQRAGLKKIKEGTCTFPKEMQSYTEDVNYFLLRITREEWQEKKKSKEC